MSDENDDGDTGNATGGGGEDGAAAGFEPITSQDALDRLLADRIRRAERNGFKKAEERYKPGADRASELEHERASDTEKAVRTAREEERKAVRGEFVPRVVRGEFRAEAKGVLTADQLDALLEDVDLARYVDDDGEPDTAKIAAKVAKFAPKEPPGGRGFPDLGAGNRGAAAKSPNMNEVIRRAAGITG